MKACGSIRLLDDSGSYVDGHGSNTLLVFAEANDLLIVR